MRTTSETPAIPFALVVLWAAVQILPWTPRAWHSGLWAGTAAFLGTAERGMISIDAQQTVDAIMRLLGYACAFLLAWGLGLQRELAVRIVKVLLWTATGCAAYGLIAQFSGSNTVLWFHKWAYLGDVTGPFVNRNNFATYVGFGAVVCLVLLFQRLKPAFEPDLSVREMITRLVKALFSDSWPYLAAGAILLTALVLTHSRAGTASTFLGLIVTCALLSVREGARRAVPLVLVVLVGLATLTVLSLSGEEVLDRALDTSATTEERPLVYTLTLAGIGDHFWAGTGLGTFDPAFAMYRNTTLQHTWNQAHNTYLETMFEIGVPAALVFLLAPLWIVALCLRGYFILHRDRVYPLVAVGCSTIAAVHSVFDFSLQIPAVATTYAMVLGLGFAQAFSTERMAAR